MVGIVKSGATPPSILTVAQDGIASFKWYHNAPSVTVFPGNDVHVGRESKLRHTCYS